MRTVLLRIMLTSLVSFLPNNYMRFIQPHASSLRSGFTLIELILYVGLLSSMMLVLSLFFSIAVSVRIKNQTVSEVEQQGLQVMQIMSQTIRNASSVNSPLPGLSSSTLSLSLATSSDISSVFFATSSILYMREGVASSVSLTNNKVAISGLLFSALSVSSSTTPGTVRIVFSLSHLNPSGRNEYDYTKTFYTTAALRQP